MDDTTYNSGMGVDYTMDEALAMVGFGRFQVLVLAYAGLGAMADSMELMILSFIGPSFKALWDLSSHQESFITTAVFAGMLIGAYSWGIICDNYGRRMGLLTVAVVTSISAFLSAFSSNYISLVLLRMIVGIGLGGGTVYSSWFLEFLPVQNRGVWMIIFAMLRTTGTILEALLAWIVMPRLGWRWLLAISSLPCLATFVLYFPTVESPRYLCLIGKITDADQVLRKMATINQKQLPSGMLVADQTKELDEKSIASEDSPLLSTRKTETSFAKVSFSRLFTLFSPSLAKSTFLIWAVYFGNSFVYYGVVLMTSELSSGQNKCGEVVLHLNQLSDSSLYRNAFVTSLAELPGVILGAVLVDKIGRKISMLVMYVFGFAFLLPLVFYQHEFLTTSLLFGARMCIIGNYTLAGVYCPEIYPTSVRTTGVGVAAAVGRIAGMLSPLVAVDLVSGCHQMAAIILFEVIIILSGIGVLLFPLETKGRELNDTVAADNINM